MCTNALILYLFMCSTNWQPNSLPVDLIVKDILTMSGHRKQYPWNDKHFQSLISALISCLILFRSNSKMHTFRMLFNFTSQIDSSVVHIPFTRLAWALTTQQKDRCVCALVKALSHITHNWLPTKLFGEQWQWEDHRCSQWTVYITINHTWGRKW